MRRRPPAPVWYDLETLAAPAHVRFITPLLLILFVASPTSAAEPESGGSGTSSSAIGAALPEKTAPGTAPPAGPTAPPRPAGRAADQASAPPPLPPPPPPIRAGTPFRLGLTYTHVLGESGDLANNGRSTNAVGLLFVSPSTSYVRDHFAIAHQWESAGSYSARGFRIDLISFGYPIRAVDTADVSFVIEPVVTALRGEIMFVSGSGSGRFLRLESGIGLDLSVAYRHWFFSAQPLAIDFRYWFYGSAAFHPQSQAGLGHIFPLRLAIGHEF
jgi:hypothetical protein